MTNVDHKTIPDADLHELKGAAGASVHTVPIADGAGSSAFGKVTSDDIDSSVQTALNNPDLVILTLRFPDLASGTTQWIVAPLDGTIQTIYGVLTAAITTADETIAASINGTPVTDGAMIFGYSGSSAGNIQSATPSAANTLSAGDAISFGNTGGCGGTCDCMITIVLDVS